MSISPAAEVQEGTATTLSCVVPGQEGRELNYTWYRNGAWLQQSPAHRMLLPRAAASDAGFYSCTASDAWGSAAAPALGLSVTCEWPRGGCGAVEWVGRGPADQPASCTRIHPLQRVLGLQMDAGGEDAGLSGVCCTSIHPLQRVLGVQMDAGGAGDADAGLSGAHCTAAHPLQRVQGVQMDAGGADGGLSGICRTSAHPSPHRRCPTALHKIQPSTHPRGAVGAQALGTVGARCVSDPPIPQTPPGPPC